MRTLLIEDDPRVASFVQRGLREAGFSVDCKTDGIAGFQSAGAEMYDVIILDLMLPGRDGFSVLRGIRDRGILTPVICLTARNAVDDRVRGLDLGADDYLVKPFSISELLARIRALLRRGVAMAENRIVIGDLHIDLLVRAVQRKEKRIELSAREFSLLEYLARHAGTVVSRAMILEKVWDMRHVPMTNVVNVHINRLRKKVDRDFDRSLIHTVRGFGYVLRDKGEVSHSD